MRQLRPSELTSLLNELQRQVALEQYNEQRNHWAFLAAVISNGFSGIARMFSKRRGEQKTITPDDFISNEFKRIIESGISEKKTDFEKNIQDAKQKGLHGPWCKGR